MRWALCIFFANLLCEPGIARAEDSLKQVSIEEIRIIRISPQDETAVIKIPGEDLILLRVGDRIGEHGRVIEITEGRVVIEEVSDQAVVRVMIRIEDGKQQIERLHREPQNRPLIYKVR